MEEHEDASRSDHMHNSAVLAESSYTRQAPDGYSVDASLSNRNRQLLVNNETGKAILSFRGTDLKSKQAKWKDLGSDALLAVGLQELSTRFRNAKKATKAAIDKYGADNVELVGHSLGGSQALYANAKYGVKTTALNPGVSPANAKKGVLDKLGDALFKRKAKSTATIYHTGAADPISALSPLVNAKVVQVKPRGKNAHSLRNFF
jgi:hypothetical protein